MREKGARWLFALILLFLGTLASLHAQESSERLQVAFDRISLDAESVRTVEGGILVGAGMVVGVGGTVIGLNLGSPEKLWKPTFLRQFLFNASWAFGGVFVIPGAFLLAQPSPYETAQGGEEVLRALAQRAETDRWLTAAVLGVAAFSLVSLSQQEAIPWVRNQAFGPPNGAKFWVAPLENPFATAGYLAFGSAIFQALVPSVPETEAREYFRWRTGAPH